MRMILVQLVILINVSVIIAIKIKSDLRESSNPTTAMNSRTLRSNVNDGGSAKGISSNVIYDYLPSAVYYDHQHPGTTTLTTTIGVLPPPPSPVPKIDLQTIMEQNSILAALLLGASLQQKTPSYNHPDHLPLNPYLELLLSHFGRYTTPIYSTGRRGIYAYSAVNNYHNNKPFGAYKIYEDNDS